MTDTTPSASSAVYGLFDGSRTPPSLSPVDAASLASVMPALPPLAAPPHEPPSARPFGPSENPEASELFKGGSVLLNRHTLRRLREAKLLSQQELADVLCRRRIQVSIATIKRAETGHRVRFRIAREFAVYFGVEFDDLLR